MKPDIKEVAAQAHRLRQKFLIIFESIDKYPGVDGYALDEARQTFNESYALLLQALRALKNQENPL